jgi:hypothetical protein
VKVENFVKTTFLKLTSTTVPYGFEDIFVDSMRDLFPKDMEQDEWGNYFFRIGNTRTIFAAHLDTVSKDYIRVNHVFDRNLIKTDGKTTLGADDKAGLTILLWMIKNEVPGLYYFFVGEEVGCIGSGNAAKFGHFEGLYDRIISFDRRDVNSVITFQSSSRCCSDEFADALSSDLNMTTGLNYKKDTGGVYTDSAEFTSIIPECTNISVGYYKEHTTQESQDIEHLTKLAEACLGVDWENLPTKRNPHVTEYTNWSHESSYDYDYGQWDGLGYGDSMSELSQNRGKRKRKRNKSKKYLDNGGELYDLDGFYEVKPIHELMNFKADPRYNWIMSQYLDSNMEYWELKFIKENYLDMDSDYDRYFYDWLLDSLYSKNSID